MVLGPVTAHPSTAPSGPGPKLAEVGGEGHGKQTPRPPAWPFYRPIRAKPEVFGKRRKRQIPRPAAHPSDAASGQGPKLAARGVESKPIQTNTYMYPAAVQQRWRSAAAVGAPPVPLPPGAALNPKIWAKEAQHISFSMKNGRPGPSGAMQSPMHAYWALCCLFLSTPIAGGACE